ncbi:helix-turn-helix domain-containing protein [Cytobacillus dafuensis]|uniref:Helix-turn-helix transcriptional regulator n=1 Tax=Cytobacillus dafuensis TaxID=1742359 RepID=A0A5B8Z2P8_CYTDA|nr:helix-turn-helix transcriptional regulator [Cytobacillus dafuensis]QED46513.1 helix-turn-helix transcriptional regulator [Cytobacillus dafuensis]
MLGERIRKLRKQKKMTLEELAGKSLTKGMLSLIENNKANPSIESLHYIAERLGVEVSDLLEEISLQELRKTLEKAEELYNFENLCETENQLIKTEQDKEIIDLIKPYIANLTQGYESARLLDIYSRCLYNEKIEGWQKFSGQAAEIYDQMNLTSKRASISVFLATEKFIEHHYEEALTIFLNDRAKIEAKHVYIDPKTRLDLDYYEAILYFAVGDSESATQVMDSAIAFSKENRIFYLIDDLYRLAAAQAMMGKNKEKKIHYLLKLKQYGEFADDTNSILFYHFMMIESLISEKHEYTEAIEKIDQCLTDPSMTETFKHYFNLEKGKALYRLARYKEALHCLEKIEIPPFIHHPFDLSHFFIMDTYKALCHLELEKVDEAFQFAEIAYNHFYQLPSTPFKDFAIETFEAIKKTRLAEE